MTKLYGLQSIAVYADERDARNLVAANSLADEFTSIVRLNLYASLGLKESR